MENNIIKEIKTVIWDESRQGKEFGDDEVIDSNRVVEILTEALNRQKKETINLLEEIIKQNLHHAKICNNSKKALWHNSQVHELKEIIKAINKY